uniref:IBR domain-containing protein n=1 Tax=Panagrolaimus sp. PS1159 TaxID=55785 RepID=A0AC35GJU3_9BILA
MQAVYEKFQLAKVKLPFIDEPQYKIFSTDLIERDIQKRAEKVKAVIENVTIDTCQKLLHVFKWDNDKLFERFFEVDTFSDFVNMNKIDFSSPEMNILSSTPEMLVTSYIQANPLLKRCPNNGCKKVVELDFFNVKDVICDCGLSYCSKCGASPHSPFPCILINEWAVQLHDFERILVENNVICPHCYEVYQVDEADHYELVCIRCDNMFNKYDNKLSADSICPEYKHYRTLSERLSKVQSHMNKTIGVEGAEFLSTVCKLAQSFFQKIRLLPIFSFYLDKEYLCKNPSTANIVPLFEYHQRPLKTFCKELFTWMDKIFGSSFLDGLKKYDEQEVLPILYSIERHLDVLFTYINDTKGWIFKLPEIQE